jgi:hypothetical protein
VTTRARVPALRGSRRAATPRSSTPALVVRRGVRRVTRSGRPLKVEGRADLGASWRRANNSASAALLTRPTDISGSERYLPGAGVTRRRYTQRPLGAHPWVRCVGVLLSSVPTTACEEGDRPHPAHARRDHDGTATRQVTSVAGEAGGWVALRRGCASLADRQPGTLAGHSRLVAPPAPCDSIRAGSGGVGSLLAWRVMPTESDHPE